MCFGQKKNQSFEKIIRTIEFQANSPDTTIKVIKFDFDGTQMETFTTYISDPIKIDTNRISDVETSIEYTWKDKSMSITKEIITPNQIVNIGFDKNGSDTFFFSSFNLGKEGLPIDGIIINHGDSSICLIKEYYSLDEFREIQTNILRDSEFLDLYGIVEFRSKRSLTITDTQDDRNRIEISLNKNCQPKKIVKYDWHPYHQMNFINKYTYKYKSNKLVELKNIDTYGDLEMIRTIEYKMK